MDTIRIDGHEFTGIHVPTEKSAVLLLRAAHGFLGCGYLSIPAANKLGDALAVVRGVASYDDMLTAQVQEVSELAAARGVQPGCTGRDALLLLDAPVGS